MELKFRVFNKTKNKFYNFDKIEIIPKIQTNIIDFTTDDNAVIVIQQYTGLKDKNGKEIYEGDLVKAKTVMESMPIWIGEVMRECDFYGLDCNQETGWVIVDKKLNSCMAFYPNQDREIIGNIYENTELIGGKNE